MRGASLRPDRFRQRAAPVPGLTWQGVCFIPFFTRCHKQVCDGQRCPSHEAFPSNQLSKETKGKSKPSKTSWTQATERQSGHPDLHGSGMAAQFGCDPRAPPMPEPCCMKTSGVLLRRSLRLEKAGSGWRKVESQSESLPRASATRGKSSGRREWAW